MNICLQIYRLNLLESLPESVLFLQINLITHILDATLIRYNLLAGHQDKLEHLTFIAQNLVELLFVVRLFDKFVH